MIDLYYWTTPNGHKLTIFLEETGLEYQIKPVNIARGEQFEESFLKISPNNRIPAIVDHKPEGSTEPVSLFESGAILIYLAEKSGQYLPKETHTRAKTLEWLMWQMAGLGPMAGQNHHFNKYAPEKIPYAIDRYVNETGRLYRVANQRLSEAEYFAGSEYSIADMAIYPWIVPYERQAQKLSKFPALEKWFHKMAERPAVVRAYEKGKAINSKPTVDEEARKHLFGQRA